MVLYLTSLLQAGRKVSTLQRRISAISQAHQAAGHDNPTRTAPVHALMAGARRTFGTAQEGKAPVWTEDLRRMVATLPDTLLGTRDRLVRGQQYLDYYYSPPSKIVYDWTTSIAHTLVESGGKLLLTTVYQGAFKDWRWMNIWYW